MINVKNNNWRPSPGFKYLTNGLIWSEDIHLGKFDSIENWHETNEEPIIIEEEENQLDDNEYKTALEILLGKKDGDL